MICDVDDWKKAKQYAWSKCSHGYPTANIGGRKIRFHKIVLNAKEGMIIDHINGNKLDNRKENLRVVTYSLNSFNRNSCMRNTSGKVGVSRCRGKWKATICINREIINLGYFDDFNDAVQIRQNAEEKYFGEKLKI